MKMDYILIGIVMISALAWGWAAGYRRGKKEAAKEIFRALGVPEGARIISVQSKEDKGK
jgi:hypothetical protein